MTNCDGSWFTVWKSQTYNRIHFKMSHTEHISFFISIEFKYSKSLRTTIFNYGLMVLERCGSNKYNVCFFPERHPRKVRTEVLASPEIKSNAR